MKKLSVLAAVLLINSAAFAQSKLPVPVQKLFSQMVYVKGGEYMYSQAYWENSRNEGTKVQIKDIYAEKYEINRELYKFITGDQKEIWNKWQEGIDWTKPANGISWYEAVNFCNKLSEAAGLKKCYKVDGTSVTFDETADGFRLPTDEEWEYLGRGGALSKYAPYAGNSNYLDDVAWTGGDDLHQSGLKKPNELGLYDLSGNVWEWCWNGDEKKRNIRGGSSETNARASYVEASVTTNPEESQSDFGFRVVRNAK